MRRDGLVERQLLMHQMLLAGLRWLHIENEISARGRYVILERNGEAQTQRLVRKREKMNEKGCLIFAQQRGK